MNMKTLKQSTKAILGFASLATFLGLFPFAFAETRPDSAEASPAVQAKRKPVATGAVKTAPTVMEKSPLTPSQEGKLLALLNEGGTDELEAIPGVAATRAASIAKARPFSGVHEVILVDGIGNATYEKILAHGKTLNQAFPAKSTGTAKPAKTKTS
mgnify:CR=1 FL=1